jgi:hypothetical protein
MERMGARGLAWLVLIPGHAADNPARVGWRPPGFATRGWALRRRGQLVHLDHWSNSTVVSWSNLDRRYKIDLWSYLTASQLLKFRSEIYLWLNLTVVSWSNLDLCQTNNHW